jgi:hypothetical protein
VCVASAACNQLQQRTSAFGCRKQCSALRTRCALSPDREEFEKADTWAGMVALATEVGAKKFSSEEETFSDLSILIFNNNFKARCFAGAACVRLKRH